MEITPEQLELIKKYPAEISLLIDQMKKLETEALKTTGIEYHSGGFTAVALKELEETGDESQYLQAGIELKWGIQNDVQNTINIEYYNYFYDEELMEWVK